jgi:hypothetical protein
MIRIKTGSRQSRKKPDSPQKALKKTGFTTEDTESTEKEKNREKSDSPERRQRKAS